VRPFFRLSQMHIRLQPRTPSVLSSRMLANSGDSGPPCIVPSVDGCSSVSTRTPRAQVPADSRPPRERSRQNPAAYASAAARRTDAPGSRSSAARYRSPPAPRIITGGSQQPETGHSHRTVPARRVHFSGRRADRRPAVRTGCADDGRFVKNVCLARAAGRIQLLLNSTFCKRSPSQ
jgi:hypothetical protein